VNIDPEYHYEAINVETQQNNPHSLLWWMKRLLAQRKQLRSLSRGSIEFLYPDNRRVLAFVRRYEEERVLVVANLSRFAQCAELDLSKFHNMAPRELFGKTAFPPIGDRPYVLSLAPHAFYWFALESKEAAEETLRIRASEPPTIPVASWDDVFSDSVRATLNRMLPYFLMERRWFRGRTRPIRLVEIQDIIPFPKSRSNVLIVRVEYGEGEPEYYTLPLSASPLTGTSSREDFQWVLANLRAPDGTMGVLYSALRNREFCDEMLAAILRRRRFPGERGEVVASHTRAFRGLWGADHPPLEPSLAKVDQDNTTLFYGDRFAFKLFRKVEPGPHPEPEIGSLLTHAEFPNAAPLAGSVEYRATGGEPMVIAVLHGFVRQGTEAWQYTLDHLGMFYEHALARGRAEVDGKAEQELDHDLMGSYRQIVRQLGQRTGELHATLASRPEDPVFAPELFTDFYRQGLYHGMLARLVRTTELLQYRFNQLPETVKADGQNLMERHSAIRERFLFLRNHRIDASRIRIHGDYHLAQALYTGKDFMLIDFEGDLSRPISERRIKRSPLHDVAGMLDSLYHASHGVLFGETPGVIPQPESMNALEAWAKFWYRSMSAEFLSAYLATPGVRPLLPENDDHLRTILGIFLLDFALRKLSYALTHFPERIRIPAHAIIELLEAS
jgi:maltose alpha-D-glucosyltransferase/alpha-amylase